ncbi:MAG: DUF4139 domain-containing protein [Planctomycetes bacterium]|nr:DUF4139 domain-containing protein [Planctomycetota bacterium]
MRAPFGFKRPVAALLLACVAGGALRAAEGEAKPAEPPPVKKVVLYKHGMGYFERRGKVNGNATVTLAFNVNQMKDLLTSFFAVDLNGGKIGSVQYETKDPLSKQLQDILINVPENNALSQFLTQLKGAKLTAKAAGDTVSGRIMGVEPVTQVVDGKTFQHGFKLVVMTDAGTIKSLDLFSIAEFSLDDEALQRDLKRLLSISLDSKYTNRKKLQLEAKGNGERELRIGYLIETPIWKTSYRAILDKKPDGKDTPALLQGWALAENTTEEDWKDVDISFVAGNPLSYVMDLYSPFYLQRPNVPIPGLGNMAANWGAAPEPTSMIAEAKKAVMNDKAKDMAGGRRARQALAKEDDAEQAAGEGGPMAPGAPMNAPAMAAQPMADLLASSVSAAAKGVKVGELFTYEGQEKVNIARGQAAMVPILSQKMKGQRLLYYKGAFSPKPANAYVLKNDSELTLEAGAVTFFEDDTALGEGILAHTLAPGGQEVLPFAIDGSVDVTPQMKSDVKPAYKASLANGVMTLTSVETVVNTWKLVNRGKQDVTLWLDQPKNVYHKLVKPEKPLDEVDNHYRFELALKAGETKDFEVEEKRDIQQAVYISNMGIDQIRFFITQQFLSDATKAFLKDVADLQNQRAELQRQINMWQQQINSNSEEQNRLRNNMNTLRADRPKEQELRAKWVDQLAASEDKITELRKQIDDASNKLRLQDEQFAKKIQEYKGE